MTYSAVATEKPVWTHQRSSRDGARIDRFIVHHAANTSVNATLELFAGARQVSANYALGNGRVVPTVPEEDRAWTSGSYEDDRRAVTVEVSNSRAGDPWPVADVEFTNLARLIADVATRYDFPITDNTVLTHQELWTRFGRSYPTACPGDLQRRKGELIKLANKYRSAAGESTTVPSKEIEVKTYHYQDPGARVGGRPLQPGKHLYLHTTKGVANDKASNVVGGVGAYSITPHLYLEGAPGDVVELTLIWAATKKPGKPQSPHYTERVVIDRDGLAMVSREFKRGVGDGDAVYVRVRSAATNTGPVKVTRLDCDAHLYVA